MEQKYNDSAEIDYSAYTIDPATGKPRKPSVLDADDIMNMVPKLKGHRKLVNGLLNFISMDKVNKIHADNCSTPGPEFVKGLLDDLQIKLKIDNADRLDHLPEGAFVTVSNHHFGALDGIILIDLFASRRPRYKVMVNMILSHIWAMRPNFMAVDAMRTDDPEKKKVSMQGIREVIRNVREGQPVGFFPSGAVAKINWKGRLIDLPWQPSVIEIIQKLKVPVVPVFFHGSQSWFFNLLGVTFWQLRTLRHPAEVFRKKGKTFHVTIGQTISVEEQLQHSSSVEELGNFLRERTYALRAEGRHSNAPLTDPF